MCSFSVRYTVEPLSVFVLKVHERPFHRSRIRLVWIPSICDSNISYFDCLSFSPTPPPHCSSRYSCRTRPPAPLPSTPNRSYRILRRKTCSAPKEASCSLEASCPRPPASCECGQLRQAVFAPPPLYSFSFYCLPSFLLPLYTLYTENYAPSPFLFDPTPLHIYHPLISKESFSYALPNPRRPGFILQPPAPFYDSSSPSLFFFVFLLLALACVICYMPNASHHRTPPSPRHPSPHPHPTSSLSPGILLFSLSLCRAALGLSRPMAPHNTESLTQTFCYFVCCSITCGFLFSF